ncbi:MAG: radical SAM protein [Dysgonamonadaceae bacterium]|jgi:MoaA/NifB/PqqE/SkfB family radical SAM enzyme|nr:radical SAM protein [Dysgonamonadaceae bacterium]
MAGAISGTAITNSLTLKQKLDTVTLTINCVCNYKCPHCYLDYISSNKYIDDNVIERLFHLDFKHLSVVGKEPFVDAVSREISKQLIELCNEKNKTISFVTNGSNLGLLQDFNLEKIKFIDVSFDGGIQFYKQYRGGNIHSILETISLLHKKGLREINALHVLSERTISYLNDMIELNSYFAFNKMMFSLYLDTNSINSRTEKTLTLQKVFQTLRGNDNFMKSTNAFLLLDKYNFLVENELTIDDVEFYINKFELNDKILLVKEDPIEYGFVRITYDGLVLTPTDSLNTREYNERQMPLWEFSNAVFEEMVKETSNKSVLV